jgi:hypothetical protein
VIRTITLLRFISEPELREEITAQTNKVEAYQGFSAWLRFGPGVPSVVRVAVVAHELQKVGRRHDAHATCPAASQTEPDTPSPPAGQATNSGRHGEAGQRRH